MKPAKWVALAVLALIGAAPVTGEGARHPLTVDDVMSVEMFGRAEFTPDGRWLAWNQVPPYDSLQDYSYWLYAYGLSGHQVWIRNLETGETRLQPGLDPAATHYIFGISPDSRHLVLIDHRRGRLRLAACRIGQDDCVRFGPMPDIRDRYISAGRYNERLVWTSPDRFVMPVRSPLQPGSEMRSRGTSGAFLWRAWNRAWDGEIATASEVRSVGGNRSGDWASGRLVEFDLAAGTVRPIAEGRYAGVRVSPDGRTLLAARLGERVRPDPGASGGIGATHPVFDRHYALRLVDAESGHVTAYDTPYTIDPKSLVWSAGGDRFAAYGWQESARPAEGCFRVFRPGAGTPPCLETGDLILAQDREGSRWWAGPARAALLPNGLAILAREPDGERFDWYLLTQEDAPRRLTGGLAAPGHTLLHADGHSLVILAGESPVRVRQDGTTAPLADGMAARSFSYRGNPAHGWANEFRKTDSLIRYDFGARFALILPGGTDEEDEGVAFAGPGGLARLETGGKGARVLAASEAAGALLFTVRDGAATRLLLKQGDDRVELARINRHLEAIAPPQTHTVTYRFSDPSGKQPSRETEACLMLPPGYRPGQRYPLLVEAYPVGTAGRCGSFTDAPFPAAMVADLWAARGFIYVRPAFPLDLARTAAGPLEGAGALFDQTVDALVAQGYADPDRVVLYGFSQGGAFSLLIAAQTVTPAAIISLNGWADFFSHYYGARGLMRYFHLDQNGGDNRWRYECELEGPNHYCPFGFGLPAAAQPGLYAALSPVARAGAIAAPVLLAHSDMDYFDMSQYDEMFGALYRAGKEARYIRYWGEGHGPSSPANIRDLWTRIDAFLAETGVMAPQDR
ncbi:S9 family peptidase [Henriciella aquimarina]|uniref:S9 family peptidase n=1 Tax=Henriciella aquimarina TaxID=545261 RepID=UPI001179E94D|nr:prolyl oligopeptidase family serine peptidase [Henriciella aquimarina]